MGQDVDAKILSSMDSQPYHVCVGSGVYGVVWFPLHCAWCPKCMWEGNFKKYLFFSPLPGPGFEEFITPTV